MNLKLKADVSAKKLKRKILNSQRTASNRSAENAQRTTDQVSTSNAQRTTDQISTSNSKRTTDQISTSNVRRNTAKRKASLLSPINSDVKQFAYEYEKRTFFEECGVCGVEDVCTDEISSLDDRSVTLMNAAFEALNCSLRQLSHGDININYIDDLNNSLNGGFLEDSEKICG